MAIRFPSPGDAVNRITNIAPATGDYTCLFWWRFTGTDAYKVLFATLDDPAVYDDWIVISSAPFAGDTIIGLSIGVNGVDHPTTSRVINVNEYYAIGYVREGNVHRFYVDNDLVGSVTQSLTGVTLGETWLGDDDFANEGDQDFFNFREWTRALTLEEMYNELTDDAVQSTTNLLTNTPLLSDLLDDSGNANDWTLVAAGSFIGTPPLNNTAFAAVQVTLPHTDEYTANNTANTESFSLWFRFVAPVGIKVVGIWGFGGAAGSGYRPRVRVFTDTLVLVLDGGTAGRNKPIQVSVTAGEIYYVQFDPVAFNATSILELNIQAHIPLPVPIGSIFINDDTDGFPLALRAGTDGAVLDFINNFPAGEAGDTLSNGISLVEDFAQGNLKLYGPAFSLIETVLIGDSPRIRTCLGTQRFWVARQVNPVQVRYVEDDGDLGTNHVLTGITTVLAIAANNDETVLYLANTPSGSPVEQWNLVTDVALSDLVAGIAGYVIPDILVLADGTLIVLYAHTGTAHVQVKHYSAAGVTLNTYDLGTNNAFPAGTLPRLAYDGNHSDSFWVWTHQNTPAGFSIFTHINVSDGVVILELDDLAEYETGVYQPAETDTPTDRFGHSFSCPFFLLQASTLPPASTFSGIYQLVPGKTNDTVFTNVTANETLVLKIPDPFIRTAALGD